MAYLKDIEQECPCGQRARVALMTETVFAGKVIASRQGVYCRPCGKEALRKLEKETTPTAAPEETTT